jgi:hypothetical protein
LPAANTERLPTRAEIADERDPLDGACAIKNFHGKTVAEAEELFAGAANSLTYTEDLSWMRPVGFRYYIRAAIRHALSERATGDSDLINGIAGVLAERHERHPRELVPCAGLLAEFCRAVVGQFDRYNADPKIYVGLRAKYERLAELFTRMTNEPGNG